MSKIKIINHLFSEGILVLRVVSVGLEELIQHINVDVLALAL